jgi:hypothetical protein
MKKPTLDEVLDAFAMEADYEKATVEGYIRKYPQFALDLIRLARELSRPTELDTSPLSKEEAAHRAAAWQRHAAAAPAHAVDPFASLDPLKSKQIAATLKVPRQVITAFRERRVDVSTVPHRFLDRLATSLDSAVEQLIATLSSSPPQFGRSYKSDDKPVQKDRISFETLLKEAGLTEEQRAAVITEGE